MGEDVGNHGGMFNGGEDPLPLTGQAERPRGEARRAPSCSRRRGRCEVLILKDRYDPFAVLAMVEGWGGEGQRLPSRNLVAGTVEVDRPSGVDPALCPEGEKGLRTR
jgi:hypothetical protein